MKKATLIYLLLIAVLLTVTNRHTAIALPGRVPACSDTNYYLVPDFYTPKSHTIRDTLIKFVCYDRRDSIIPKVKDYDSVKYYSVFKSYIDSTHTYKDRDGKKQFLPVSKIIKRYDRLGKLRWMCVTYPGNAYSELKDNKNIIVRADTIAVNNSGNTIIEIYKYYKTEVF